MAFCFQFLLVLLTLTFDFFTNNPENGLELSGKPFISNIKYSQYISGRENWCVVQNQQGLIYVANQNGILEYDSYRWRQIELKNRATPLWMDIDSLNTIYVASSNEFGFLKPDEKGELIYHSLRDSLPDSILDTGEIWECRAASNGVFFRSYRYIFRWHESRLSIIEKPSDSDRFDVMSVAWGKPTFRIAGKGIYTFTKDSITLLPGSEAMASVKINGFLELENGEILIVSRREGLFRYDGKNTRKVISKDSQRLIDGNMYDALKIGRDRFVVATLYSGVLIINGNGEILRIFNEENGLNDNYGLFNFLDREGGLWIGHDNGLSRIFLSMPFRVFDKTTGLNGNLETMIRFKEKLYITSSQGLFEIEEKNSDTPDQFPRAKRLNKQPLLFRPLAVADNLLLAGSSAGAFSYDGNSLTQISTADVDLILPLKSVENSLVYSNRFYGIGVMRKFQGKWTDLGRIQSFPHTTVSMTEFGESIWLSTPAAGIFRISTSDFSSDPEKAVATAIQSGPVSGLSTDHSTQLIIIRNELVAINDKGISRWNGTSFVPYTELQALIPDGFNRIHQLHQDHLNRLWFKVSDGRKYEVRVYEIGEGNSYTKIAIPFLSPSDKNFNQVYSEPNGTTWMIHAENILKLRENGRRKMETIPPPIIRELLVNGETVITGTFFSGPMPILTFGDYFLRFRFAAPVFNQISSMQYRVSLSAGNEEIWSAWTPEPEKDYTNLREGIYTFKVQARNPQGLISETTQFRFKITPPWYRTWFAYLFISVLMIGGIVLLVYWRTALLSRQKRELQEAVAEKTSQLLHAEKMASIGQLTAGLGHEINNPLTIVQLNAEILKMTMEMNAESPATGDTIKSLDRIFDGVGRIRRIVEKMVQFSTSEEFDRPVSAGDYLESVMEILRGTFPTVTFRIENLLPESAILHGTRLKMILFNVLTNAAEAVSDRKKPAGEGFVQLTVRQGDQSHIEFIIRDNGIGIPVNMVSKVFEPFFTTKAPGEGTGLGLFETYNMVRQENGDIHLASTEGIGTTVSIRMPAPN